MTPCTKVILFIDGMLSASAAQEFRAHLADCASCRARVIEGLQLSAQLSTLAPDLKQLIRTWVAADDAWQACPSSDVARFARTWHELQEARKALRDVVWQEGVFDKLHTGETK